MKTPQFLSAATTPSLPIFAALAAIAGLVSVGLILGLQIYLRRQRHRRFLSLELVPNILMTRYPLMFVGRPRSIFRLSGDFLELPVFLQEHGFQVDEVEIQEGRDSTAALLHLLATNQSPVHLIVSPQFAEAAYDLALDGHAKLSTLTLLADNPVTSHHLRPTRLPVFECPELRPSLTANSFKTEEFALKHMVSLAEYDLR